MKNDANRQCKGGSARAAGAEALARRRVQAYAVVSIPALARRNLMPGSI